MIGKTPRDIDKAAPQAVPWQITMALVAGVAVLAAYATGSTGPFKIFAILFILSGAAFLIGALVGFLFGVPKSRTDGSRHADERADGSGKSEDAVFAGGSLREKYWDNANLEEVSDWLTKIIVGVGLVQLGSISGYFHSIGEVVEPVLGADGKLVLQGALLYFVVLGFIFCYLWTRVVFYGILTDVSDVRRTVRRELAQFETRTTENLEEAVIVVAAQTALGDTGTVSQREFLVRQLEEIAAKGQLEAQGYVALARLYRRLDKLDKAIATLTKYIDKNQNVDAPHKGMHASLYNRSCYAALLYGKLSDGALANHAIADLRLSLKYSANFEADVTFARGDPDLVSIRADERFAEILGNKQPPGAGKT
jgi:hypothetical protein